MLPLPARMDLWAMTRKKYSAFPKAQALLEPHYQIVLCHIQDIRKGWSYSPAEKNSMDSTAQPTGQGKQVKVKNLLWKKVDAMAFTF